MLKSIGNVFVFGSRFLLPIICILFIFIVIKDLFKKSNQVTLAKLVTANGLDFDICSVESIIGRSKICDVVLNIPSISRRHAVITYSNDYGFKISSVYGTEILVNGTVIDEYAYFDFGDIIEIGGLQLKLIPAEEKDIFSQSKKIKKRGISAAILLTVIQAIMFLEIMIHYVDDFKVQIPVAFGILFAVEWIYFLISGFSDNISVEILGFFLTTFGFSVAASVTPNSMLKQLITAILGIIAFVVLQFVFKKIDLVMKLRYFAGGLAVIMLGYNLLFGVNINGAKNWIKFGSFTFQPSEVVKFLFIFTAAATLQNLLSKRNLILFLGFSACCMGALVIMRDFGTCSIFFVTVLIIIYMRSGNVKIISAITAGVAACAAAVVKFVPYVKNRFAIYRHVWEDATNKGYQQASTMIAIASGALFGVGGASGKLKYVFAADTDIVFGVLCEEWGMIVSFCVIACFVLFAFYSLKCVPFTNSTYFAIAACSAAGLWIFQISLNIFGSTDLLPLTGVTLPFISNGGSSMISSWLLLSFIKAVGKNTLKEPAIYDKQEGVEI